MKTNTKRMLAALLLLGLSGQAMAQAKQQPAELRFLIGGALELGGDNVATVYFTNGEDQKVRAGQGGSLAVGGQLRFAKDGQFLLRSTIGIKYLTTPADNAHIRLTRIPFITTANWMVHPKVRIGAGLNVHTGINFKADGIGDNMKFKSAAGPIFEVAVAGIGLSYTAMKYQDQLNNSYSANAIGLTFSGVIQPKNKK